MDAVDQEAKSGAERALSAALGGRVLLGSAEPLRPPNHGGRSSIYRFTPVDGPSGTPASVIVKRAVARGAEGYDPGSATSGPARRLLNEWAGLRFLRETLGEDALTPQMYAGDRATGVMVLEDVGGGVGLHDVLLAADPDLARTTLTAYAATLGRMHARTAGRQEEYSRVRGALGPGLPAGLIESTAAEAVLAPAKLAESFLAACGAAGIAPARGLDADLAEAVSSLVDPGPFLTYVHGDPCPDNCLWRDGRVWLLDFEFGGFSHALTDAVYGHLLFPTCWCVGRLPGSVTRQMEVSYKAALAQGCPDAEDDTRFYRGVVAACAYWVMGMLYWAVPAVLARDERWGTATWRQRVLVRLDVLAGAAATAGYLEALGATARVLAAELRSRWAGAVEALPYYPAFSRG